MKARLVPAGHGWLWIKQAFLLFKANPFMWIALCVGILLTGALIGMIPIIGALFFQLIAPALTAGLILGCDAQKKGQPLEMSHLLAGFKSHGTPLITVGGIYLTGMLIIAGIVGVLGGEPLILALTAGHPDAKSIADSHVMNIGLMPVIVGLVLLLPLLMAYWFAPALIVFGNMSPLAAMKTSLSAGLRNSAAFLVYGLITFGLLLLSTLALMLGFLVMIPLAFISYYTSYQDVFGREETPVPAIT
ncbi:MAG TPA: BPSS1780 family membrane protein [Burkholderiales bacterium]|nr:BPSS1780 family membrane protein [Burkholderiales bacterium]